MMTTIDTELLLMVTGGKGQQQPGATQQQPGDDQASAPASGGFQSVLSALNGIFGWISQFAGHLQQGTEVVGGLANDFQQLQQIFAQFAPQSGAGGAPQQQQSADA